MQGTRRERRERERERGKKKKERRMFKERQYPFCMANSSLLSAIGFRTGALRMYPRILLPGTDGRPEQEPSFTRRCVGTEGVLSLFPFSFSQPLPLSSRACQSLSQSLMKQWN
ncbi:hypothetical protein CEXT_479191 [Caerostris extrusa]|uniref:Uncharacterized protein n=1 Tax=Caerostris extrusa TaxID=172846 RepID=A0AAV4R6F2_CAEEX|nr:hypothetical protein CEXT_479191 [Caerostris extrusa]